MFVIIQIFQNVCTLKGISRLFCLLTTSDLIVCNHGNLLGVEGAGAADVYPAQLRAHREHGGEDHELPEIF